MKVDLLNKLKDLEEFCIKYKIREEVKYILEMHIMFEEISYEEFKKVIIREIELFKK